MKYKNNHIISLIVICLVALCSCTADFEDMNIDSTQATSVEPELIFPFVLRDAANLKWDNYQVGENLHSNLYAQYIANTSQNFPNGRYQYNDFAMEGFWRPYYANILKNIIVVEEELEKYPHSQNTYQLLRILRAMSTAKITDLFGDIPYFKAGRGEENLSYDTQKDIYYDIFKELTEAVDVLKSNIPGQKGLKKSDFIYGGDITKWIKFANSLRLRYALRISFIDPDKAKMEGEKALASGVMENVLDRAVSLTNKVDNPTLGYPLITICHWNEFRMSKTMENILLTLSSVEDPRTELIWGQTKAHSEGKGPKYRGVPNGLSATELGTSEYNLDNFSNVYGLQFFPEWNTNGVAPKGGDWISKPYPIMNYSEVCFLKAEAAIRGWKGAGDVKENYEEGIKVSFEENRQGVDPTLYSVVNDLTYLSTGDVKWNSSLNFENKLEKIITQKWIALFPLGSEAWSEFRRTGYPRLQTVKHSDNPDIDPSKGEFIKKIIYVDEERRDNKVHSSASDLNQGQGDGANVRVWWDTKRYK